MENGEKWIAICIMERKKNVRTIRKKEWVKFWSIWMLPRFISSSNSRHNKKKCQLLAAVALQQWQQVRSDSSKSIEMIGKPISPIQFILNPWRVNNKETEQHLDTVSLTEVKFLFHFSGDILFSIAFSFYLTKKQFSQKCKL